MNIESLKTGLNFYIVGVGVIALEIHDEAMIQNSCPNIKSPRSNCVGPD